MGKKLNPLKNFRFDAVLIDNPIFKLHHQVNFFLVLFGVVFVFSMNNFNEKAIICKNDNEFVRQYCWLHGSGHISPTLSKEISGEKCRTDQIEAEKDPEKVTHYYLWLPFVLTLLLAIIKMPRALWKAVEGEFMKDIIGENKKIEEINEKIKALKKSKKWKKKARRYNYNYALCELLNIVCLILCFIILDALFGLKGAFVGYGHDVFNYQTHPDSDKPDYKEKHVSPRCNLLPTEVSCNVNTGGIDNGLTKIIPSAYSPTISSTSTTSSLSGFGGLFYWLYRPEDLCIGSLRYFLKTSASKSSSSRQDKT